MVKQVDEKKLNEIGRKVMDAMEEINLVLQFPQNLVDVEFTDESDDVPLFGQDVEKTLTFTIKYLSTDELRDARDEHLDEVEQDVLKMLEDIRKKRGQ